MADSSTVQWIAENDREADQRASKPEGSARSAVPTRSGSPPGAGSSTRGRPASPAGRARRRPTRRPIAGRCSSRCSGPRREPCNTGEWPRTSPGRSRAPGSRGGSARLGPGRLRSGPNPASGQGGRPAVIVDGRGLADRHAAPRLASTSNGRAARPVLRSPDDHVPGRPTRSTGRSRRPGLGTLPPSTPTSTDAGHDQAEHQEHQAPLPRVAEPGEQPLAEPARGHHLEHQAERPAARPGSPARGTPGASHQAADQERVICRFGRRQRSVRRRDSARPAAGGP